MIEFVEPEFAHQDSRGQLKQLVSSGWSQINVIHSDKGAIRGNHFHKQNKELFYIIKGTFTLTLECNGNIKKYSIKQNDMFIIRENTTHSFEFTEDTILVSMYDNGVELEGGQKDIFSKTIN